MNCDNLLAILERFRSVRILVLGDVMLDRFVYGSVDRISPEAPIPVLSVDRQVDMPGGAANVVRNCASLGAGAILVGVVGNDGLAQDLLTQLTLLPAVEAHLIADSSRPTTLKTRFVADRQQLMRADIEQRTAISDALAENVLVAYRKALVDADIVVLSDYAKGVLSEQVTRAAITMAREAGKAVVVDPKSL
jgi:D-beta-D-heptose 7-phosphate kinase/D-beta-D-heptose 1-phosphate adenosyltransferase